MSDFQTTPTFQPSSTGAPEPPEGWRAAYIQANNRARAFTVATIVLAICTALAAMLAGMMLIWAVAATAGNHPPRQPGMSWDRGQGPGEELGGAQLFNRDGSLDTAKVARLKQRMDSGRGPSPMVVTAMVARAVASGVITVNQGEELLTALGLNLMPMPAATPGQGSAPGAIPSASPSTQPGTPKATTPTPTPSVLP